MSNINELKSKLPLNVSSMAVTVHNQAKALKSLASVTERFEHQLNNMKRITIDKQERITELEEEVTYLREDNENMGTRIQFLEKENEDLRKNVTKN